MKHLLPLCLLLGAVLSSGSARGQENAGEKTPPAQEKSSAGRKFLGEWEKLLDEGKQVYGNQLQLLQNHPQLRVQLKDPTFVHFHRYNAQLQQSEQYRYFLAEMELLNVSDRPVELPRTGIVTIADGKRVPHSLPEELKGTSFYTGTRSLSLSSLKFDEVVKIPAGQVATTWVIAPGLVHNQTVPKLQLELTPTDLPAVELNVNQYCHALLKLKAERIGPRGGVGHLAIAGHLNPINVEALLEEIQKMIKQGVRQVIISWEKNAPRMDSYLNSWLQQSAQNIGVRPYNFTYFPSFPGELTELHLVKMPGSSQSQYWSGPIRLHDSTANALRVALFSTYQRVSVKELIQDLEQGNEDIQLAALTNGAERLPANYLPQLLQRVKEGKPEMQKAAVYALQFYGDDAAIEKLIELAKSNQEPLASEALKSLVTSRYGKAHTAVEQLLHSQPEAAKNRIVKVIAENPRSLWADTMYEYARDLTTPLGQSALDALMEIGHPQLMTLIENALRSKNQQLREKVFTQLVKRTDSPSEKLAMNYVLEQLETRPPNNPMVDLIRRTKEQRAVPYLIKHFNDGSQKSNIIDALKHIGNQEAVRFLVEQYPKLNESDKSTALAALQYMEAPEFVPLAREALLSKHSSLLNQATNGLAIKGTPEASRYLLEALKKNDSPESWNYIINALQTMGTSDVRQALQELTTTEKNEKKLEFVKQALNNLYARSPAQRFVQIGSGVLREGNYKDALEIYDLAVQVDPNFPVAWAGRGKAYLRLDEWKKAIDDLDKAIAMDATKADVISDRAQALCRLERLEESIRDYERSLKLDPEDQIAVTGLGIARVMHGQLEKGIEEVEKQAEKYKESDVYAYNTACVYGQAIGYLRKHPEVPDRDELMKQYEAKGIEKLHLSRKLGFNQFELMKVDPDLDTFRDHPDFKGLMTPPLGEQQPENREGEEEQPVEEKRKAAFKLR